MEGRVKAPSGPVRVVRVRAEVGGAEGDFGVGDGAVLGVVNDRRGAGRRWRRG